MRGTGKSTVGRLVASKIQKEYIETDIIIMEKTGLPISKIVAEHGWDYFRNLETKVIEEVATYDGKVVTTGAGIITVQKNIRLLKPTGKFFLLTASIPTMLKRLENDQRKPRLTTRQSLKEELEEVLSQRQELYLDAADEIIETDFTTPEEVADMIAALVKGVSVTIPYKKSMPIIL